MIRADLWRPLVGPIGVPLAAGWARASAARHMATGAQTGMNEVPSPAIEALTCIRPPVLGFDWTRPLLMAILNVTPDSFSDGGQHVTTDTAVRHARQLLAEGADILDIGGESTRPGATTVPDDIEIGRVVPVIAALRDAGITAPISIDTRKASVAAAAVAAGASMVNDVSALTHDPAMAGVVAQAAVPVCLMHAQGPPETMQTDPRYSDVTCDVITATCRAHRNCHAGGYPTCQHHRRSRHWLWQDHRA